VGEQIDAAPVARNAYRVDGRAVLSIQVIDNIPHIITEKGTIQAFNGAGFTTVAALPFVYSDDVLDGVRAGQIQDSNRARPVHPKGMQNHNDSLYININTELDGGANYPDRTPSGIWEYNRLTNNLTHRFAMCETATQFGFKVTDNTGPIMIVDSSDTFLIAGSGAQSSNDGMYAVSSSASPFGYFVTKEIQSETIQDLYEKIVLKAKTPASGENIVAKYRTSKRDRMYAPGAFLDASTLNTTTTLTGAAVGDEVTVLTGPKAGYTAHISEIQTSGTVTSLTLDDAIGVAGSATFEIQNFKKLEPEYDETDGEYKSIGVAKTSPWIEYKIWLNGAIELRQFISKGNAKTEL
jgi:hypothetical protein